MQGDLEMLRASGRKARKDAMSVYRSFLYCSTRDVQICAVKLSVFGQDKLALEKVALRNDVVGRGLELSSFDTELPYTKVHLLPSIAKS